MALTYTHAPRPTAGPVTFTLAGDRLTVDSGRMVQEVRLGTVDLVRLTYEPRGLARTAFRTRLRLKDGKSFAFSSLSWRSMIDAEERAVEYRAFTRALLDAVAQANPQLGTLVTLLNAPAQEDVCPASQQGPAAGGGTAPAGG
jgi:hypothetical protein